jgi:uncharacterized protein YcbX
VEAKEAMATVGAVEDIRRYPVKSMEGELLDEIALGARGLPGDRAWAVRDEVRGGIRGAKKIPGLMRLSAVYPSAPAEEGRAPPSSRFPTVRPAGQLIPT